MLPTRLVLLLVAAGVDLPELLVVGRWSNMHGAHRGVMLERGVFNHKLHLVWQLPVQAGCRLLCCWAQRRNWRALWTPEAAMCYMLSFLLQE